MPRKQFERLPDAAFVFRLAETGKSYLPPGVRLPNAELFEPSTEDKREGERRRRPAGVSVWDQALATVDQATAIRFAPADPPEGVRAFGLEVREVLTIGSIHNRQLEIVADPRPEEDGPGAEGHSLIEGLERPRGLPRPHHKNLLTDLIDASEEVA